VELAILNTTIITMPGDYSARQIDLEAATKLVADAGGNVRSYVGHEATRNALSALLGTELAFSRDLFAQQPGQAALCFKLRGRFENGKELSVADLERIGYDLVVLTRTV
jgi:hypothetical protein